MTVPELTARLRVPKELVSELSPHYPTAYILGMGEVPRGGPWLSHHISRHIACINKAALASSASYHWENQACILFDDFPFESQNLRDRLQRRRWR